MEELKQIEDYRIPEVAVEIPDERLVTFLGRSALEADMQRYHQEASAAEEKLADFGSWQRHRWALGARQEVRNNRAARHHHPTRRIEAIQPIFPDDVA